jgi:hypothetical protein
MGAKGSKNKQGGGKGGSKPSHTNWPGVSPTHTNMNINIQPRPTELSEADYTFLASQTGMNRQDIKQAFDKFNTNNPDGRLDRKEFVNLYISLRPESPERLDEISEFVFRAFDTDKNGYLTFNEFMVIIIKLFANTI